MAELIERLHVNPEVAGSNSVDMAHQLTVQFENVIFGFYVFSKSDNMSDGKTSHDVLYYYHLKTKMTTRAVAFLVTRFQ